MDVQVHCVIKKASVEVSIQRLLMQYEWNIERELNNFKFTLL